MAYTNYSQLFSQAEQKYGLRPGTGAALMSLEDASGNPYAKSPAGAMGPLQLMPGTASDMGVSNPYNPAANIDGGLHYFSNILNGPAHGDYRTAAMGYNAGPNRSNFPPEVQNYANQFVSRLGTAPQPQAQPGAQPMPPQSPPASLGAFAGMQALSPPQPMQQAPTSLGDLASSLPQGNIPKPSKFTAGNIMGVLGDALSAYGGKQPTFGPFLRQQQLLGQQQNFEMQKYRQQIAMQMYLMINGLDTETGKQLIAAGVQPGTPEWQAGMARSASNSLDPVVNTAQGPVLRSSVVPHFDPQAVAMLREAMAKGDHAAAQEFDEHFGRGAALQALGQQ
jgi:hypothetical protein